MRRLIFVSLFLLCVGGAYSYTFPFRDDPESRIMRNLNYIENMYFRYLNSHERKEAVRLLNETKELIVRNIGGSIYPNIMSEESFLILFNNVKNEITDASKTKVIQASLGNGKITCSQLERLIAVYKFDNRRVELIKSIADKIIDPVNIEVVLQHIDSSLRRNELRELFNKIKLDNW